MSGSPRELMDMKTHSEVTSNLTPALTTADDTATDAADSTDGTMTEQERLEFNEWLRAEAAAHGPISRTKTVSTIVFSSDEDEDDVESAEKNEDMEVAAEGEGEDQVEGAAELEIEKADHEGEDAQSVPPVAGDVDATTAVFIARNEVVECAKDVPEIVAAVLRSAKNTVGSLKQVADDAAGCAGDLSAKISREVAEAEQAYVAFQAVDRARHLANGRFKRIAKQRPEADGDVLVAEEVMLAAGHAVLEASGQTQAKLAQHKIDIEELKLHLDEHSAAASTARLHAIFGCGFSEFARAGKTVPLVKLCDKWLFPELSGVRQRPCSCPGRTGSPSSLPAEDEGKRSSGQGGFFAKLARKAAVHASVVLGNMARLACQMVRGVCKIARRVLPQSSAR